MIQGITDDKGRRIVGMVRFGPIEGGDVFFPGDPETATAVTVSSMRPYDTFPLPEQPSGRNMHLHRVVFPDVGKPLWTFTSPEQLVRAMDMALEAHRELCELGILHRDISPGNIMIRMAINRDASTITEEDLDIKDTQGFLTDFELAEIIPSSETGGTTTATDDAVTGTLSVMASPLLQAIISLRSLSKESQDATVAPIHTQEHDIESFGWVFFFVVYKAAVDFSPTHLGDLRKDLTAEFKELFPGISPTQILQGRLRLKREDANTHMLEYIDHHLKDPNFKDLFAFIRKYVLDPRLPRADTEPNDFDSAILEENDLDAAVFQQPPAPHLTHKLIHSAFVRYLEVTEKTRQARTPGRM